MPVHDDEVEPRHGRGKAFIECHKGIYFKIRLKLRYRPQDAIAAQGKPVDPGDAIAVRFPTLGKIGRGDRARG
jgi:hypothetical protein